MILLCLQNNLAPKYVPGTIKLMLIFKNLEEKCSFPTKKKLLSEKIFMPLLSSLDTKDMHKSDVTSKK